MANHLRAATNPFDQIEYCYALGQILEKQGRYDQAFDAFRRANASIRTNLLTEEHLDFDPHIAQIAEFLKISSDLDRKSRNFSYQESQFTPIFITGMPRSGRSLFERMLSSYQDSNGTPIIWPGNENTTMQRTIDCLSHLSDQGQTGVSATHMSALRLGYCNTVSAQHDLNKKPQVKYVTDVAGLNYQHLDPMNMLFPEAPIIWIERDPIDTCLSLFKRNFGNPEIYSFSYDLNDLGLFYTKIYSPYKTLYANLFPEGRILFVNYEDLIMHARETMEKVLSHCGLEWSETCLQHERKPGNLPADLNINMARYTSSIGAWRKYEKHLGPLLQHF